jgi:hypothetical protein
LALTCSKRYRLLVVPVSRQVNFEIETLASE